MRADPKRPAITEQTERQGIRTVIAINRGATRRRSGPIPIASIASTSSATCIVPSSAVNAAPIRAAKTMPVSNGPSSRVKAIEISVGTRRSVPNFCSWYPVSKAMVSPRKKETTRTKGTDPTPVRSVWAKNADTRNGRRPRLTLSPISPNVLISSQKMLPT